MSSLFNGRRVPTKLLLASGVFALVAMTSVVSRWIDVGDSTCGALYRVDLWKERSFCHASMIRQDLLAVGLAAAAAVCLVAAIRTSR